MDRHPSCKTIFAIHILKWIVDSISQFVLYQLMTSDSSNLVFFLVVLRLPRPLLLIMFLYAKCLMFLKRCIKTGNFHQVDQVCIIISVPLEIFKSELSFL